MEIVDLKRVDDLWAPTQPYIVAQIMDEYGETSGDALELGPFAGGIAIELKKQYPGLNITIADEQPEVVDFIRQKVARAGFAGKIAVKPSGLNRLDFKDASFDLVIFRGAFFFLPEKENLLDEIFRVMKQGGLAFIGGGHGRGVPQHIINEIASDLRTLHGKLGGRYLSIADLNRVVSRSSIKDKYLIKEDGGTWLNIRK